MTFVLSMTLSIVVVSIWLTGWLAGEWMIHCLAMLSACVLSQSMFSQLTCPIITYSLKKNPKYPKISQNIQKYPKNYLILKDDVEGWTWCWKEETRVGREE